MIIVTDHDGVAHEFDTGARFFTDEHNNLCIQDARERLVHVFAAGKWFDAEGTYDGAD